MSGLDDSTVVPRRGCCGACALVLCKTVKVLLHVAIVFTVLVLMTASLIVDSFGAKIALQSVSFAVMACLYICTSSNREGRIISGVFLGVLAVVIVTVASSVASKSKMAPVIVMSVCNHLALLVYCIWKISALVQACLRRLRAGGQAPAADQEVPLGTMVKSDAVQMQPATSLQIDDLLRKFSYDEIRAVTRDFGTMVGRGGSAEVFRGLLDDGTTAVAVKRITSDKPVGEEDFLREISIVANVHQRSLVRLLGYCLVPPAPGGATAAHGQYLVYPFFENGSLDWWLFHGEERRRHLPWPTRRRIAVDVARALAYLHHECRLQILHLDIKPANILLDGSFRAHVSDFGISMSVAQDLTSVNTRGRGTPGYMAPEMLDSALSAKSDVYSYGVMLLELVGGRRGYKASSRDSSSEIPDLFARIVPEMMARGELMEVVDATMAPAVHEYWGEVEALVTVALRCVQHQREMRPSMLTVVEMLEGRIAADLPPVARPVANFT